MIGPINRITAVLRVYVPAVLRPLDVIPCSTVAWQKCLSPATREWLDEAVLSNASTTEQNVARKNKNRDEHNANKEEGGAFNTSKSAPSLPGRFGSRAEGVRRVETSGRAGGDEQEPSVLATLREKIRTIGAYGERGTISGRYGVSIVMCRTAVQADPPSVFTILREINGGDNQGENANITAHWFAPRSHLARKGRSPSSRQCRI